MSSHAPGYHGYRFPTEIIIHAVGDEWAAEKHGRRGTRGPKEASSGVSTGRVQSLPKPGPRCRASVLGAVRAGS